MFLLLLIGRVNSLAQSCLLATQQSDCTSVVNGIYECIWSNGQCLNKVCNLLSATNCDGQVYANQACYKFANGTGCGSATSCGIVDNSNSCGLVVASGQQCFWDATSATGTCRAKTCSDLTPSTCSLVNNQYCYTSGTNCLAAKTCTDLTDQTVCSSASLQSSKCQWASSKCTNFSCKNFVTNEQCISQTLVPTTQCFNADVTGLVNCTSCSDQLAQCDCENLTIFGCGWVSGTCVRQSCEYYTSKSTCTTAFDQFTCVWYEQKQQCVSNLQAAAFDSLCDIYAFANILAVVLIYIL